jgi:hypothetical protein
MPEALGVIPSIAKKTKQTNKQKKVPSATLASANFQTQRILEIF